MIVTIAIMNIFETLAIYDKHSGNAAKWTDKRTGMEQYWEQ